jgi:hypothetical protein
LEGLDKLFEFNLYCYKALKIQNILIIRIHLSFSTKALSKNMEEFSLFLSTPLPPKPSPSLQTPKQTLTLFPFYARLFTEGGETREKL